MTPRLLAGTHRVASALGVLLALALLAGRNVQAAELQIAYDDGRATVKLPLERLESDSSEWFVGANALCRILDLERFWKPETRKLVFKAGERRIQVSVDTRLVLDGDEEVMLRVPVRYRHGSVMLPLEFLERVLAPALPGGLRFDRAALVLGVGRGASDVVGIDYDTSSGDTVVRLRLARPFRHRVQATSQSLVRVRIFDARIDPVALAADKPAPQVRRLRSEQSGSEAVVYLELERGVEGFDSRQEDDGRTLVVALRRQVEQLPLPEFKLPETPGLVAEEPERDSCSLLVLDAGHGGTDSGAQASGLVEKDVTLELATRLKPLLERTLDMRVELLRSADRVIADDRRAESANQMAASLLISLHCNGWFGRAASGYEIQFAGPQTMRRAEGRVAGGAAGKGDFRPWTSAQLPYASRSQALAQLLQGEMEQRLELRNRGAKESDLEFLKGVAMPAVVVEVGFLTNPEEADAISAPEFAAHLADAFSAAVQRYCEQARSGSFGGDRVGLRGGESEREPQFQEF